MNDKQALYYAVAELRQRGLFPCMSVPVDEVKPVVRYNIPVIDPDSGVVYNFCELERRW